MCFKSNILVVLLIDFLLFIPVECRAVSDFLKHQVNSVLAGVVAEHQLPALSMVLVNDSEIIAEFHHVGKSWVSSHAPLGLQSIYRTGSVGKILTDLAVLIAYEKSLVDLDEDIRTYLPSFSPNGLGENRITLRHLMKHQAGLVREPPDGHYFDDSSPGLTATVDSLNDTTLLWEPGSKTKYSNAGLAVVGRILEKVFNMPYEDVLSRYIFQPMKMPQSRVGFHPSVAPALVKGQMWFPGKVNWDAPVFNLGMQAAGDIYASMGDMANFMISLLGDQNRPVSAITFRLMWAPSLTRENWQMEVGLGFNLLGNFEGHYQLARHGGAVYGFATELALLPREKLGVYAVTNKDMANGVVKAVAHWLLGAVLKDRNDQAIPEFRTPPLPFATLEKQIAEFDMPQEDTELSGLVGRYGWEHNPLIVYQKEGKLFALIEWFFLYPLSRDESGKFHFPSWSLYGYEDVWFSFERSEIATGVDIGHGKRGVHFRRLD